MKQDMPTLVKQARLTIWALGAHPLLAMVKPETLILLKEFLELNLHFCGIEGIERSIPSIQKNEGSGPKAANIIRKPGFVTLIANGGGHQ